MAAPVAAATPAVRCAGLTYRFGTHTAVSGLDLEIAPGETFGLLGPNGAGKTTTIRMLTTLLKPMEGSVAVFGVNAAAQPMTVRRVIGYVPQLLSADATLTGRENVELFARLFDVPRKARAERGAAALAAMGLEDAADRIVKTYSGGMIRRLELAQALVSAPRLLVLDEPTDRLMGIGQAITMPLFFSSNALYPEQLMPGWLQAVSKVNPLSYEVDALRGLLIGTPAHLWLDAAVLVSATIAGITAATLLLPRLAR